MTYRFLTHFYYTYTYYEFTPWLNFRVFACNLDPNQQYYGGQPHPQAGFAPGYPPQAGYPPQPGFQQPGYPPQPGFQQPGYGPQPPYGQQGGFDYGGHTQSGPYGGDDPKDGSLFEDASIRRGFIRKVYAILMVSECKVTINWSIKIDASLISVSIECWRIIYCILCVSCWHKSIPALPSRIDVDCHHCTICDIDCNGMLRRCTT